MSGKMNWKRARLVGKPCLDYRREFEYEDSTLAVSETDAALCSAAVTRARAVSRAESASSAMRWR